MYDYSYTMLDREAVDSGSTTAIYREWYELMASINPEKHQFTRETDFLPSIAGIASLFSKRLNDDYAAGLWKNSMHQSLCWAENAIRKPTYRKLLKRLKSPSPYIAPSWSWASRCEAFSFGLYDPHFLADCRQEFHSLDMAIDLRGESVFGEVRAAALDITSKVYVRSPRMTYHHPVEPWDWRSMIGPSIEGQPARLQDTVHLDGRYFANIEPDCRGKDIFKPMKRRTLRAPISFLLIGSTIRRYLDAGDLSSSYFDSFENSGEEADGGLDTESFETSDEEADAGLDTESFSTSISSTESSGGSEIETISMRVAYGLLIHATGNPDEYYRVGTFFSYPYSAGGMSFFDNVEVRKVRLVNQAKTMLRASTIRHCFYIPELDPYTASNVFFSRRCTNLIV
jgi:hypothetical protein